MTVETHHPVAAVSHAVSEESGRANMMVLAESENQLSVLVKLLAGR